MSTVFGVILLLFVMALVVFGATRLISRLDNATESNTSELALARVELDLRALEYLAKSNPANYTKREEAAYALLISQRNAMVNQPTFGFKSEKTPRQVNARLAGGPVRLLN